MDRITTDIYVGDIHDADETQWLREGSPTAVLRLTRTEPSTPYPDAVRVEAVPLVDGRQNEYSDFERAVETLLDLLEADHAVFVHCTAGISRSGAVVAAAVAVRHDLTTAEAVAVVEEHRPATTPHPHLRDQAEQFVEG